MTTALISLYPNIKEITKSNPIDINLFLEYISDGKWQDIVLPIRALKTDEERREAKKKAPNVTVSGIFSTRNDACIASHSGYISMDIDDVDEPEETKFKLQGDPYLFAAFKSISGRGVCCIFKINGEKHREAFAGLSEYLFTTYNITCDPTSVNPSRARFISYDPHLVINEHAQKFTQYPKIKPPKKIDQIIFVQNDFEHLIGQIQQRNLNICENYHDWLRVGFALADKFKESGRNYFHIVSQTSHKYNTSQCDRQYNCCLKANGSRLATIATFYYYCKQSGLEIYSDQTKKIITAAANAKKGHRTAGDTVKNLKQFEGIPEQEAAPLIEQVFNSQVQAPKDDLFSQVEQWLRHNYSLRKNIITRNIENNDIVIDEYEFNSLYVDCKKVFDKIKYEDLARLINSQSITLYNPIKDFFVSHSHIQPSGLIDSLFDTILTEDYLYTRYFGKKWLVSIIYSVFERHSPLMLVLSGPKIGTGKTEWFRRLLPSELKKYFGDISTGMKENDLHILMTQKLLLLDDEFEAKRKKEENAMKSMLSKDIFSLREPYGRRNVDLRRLAVLCGTCNEEDILADVSNNRRFIPIGVLEINQQDYNNIDKTGLFIEAYHLWKSGFNCELTSADIELLSSNSQRFENYSSEYELILKFYKIPENDEPALELTATEIKNKLETVTTQKLYKEKIGIELKKIGFNQRISKINGKTARLYTVHEIGNLGLSYSGYS